MSTATITSKGQITIPADVREQLGLEQGDRVEFVRISENEYSFIPTTRSIKTLSGWLKGVKPDPIARDDVDTSRLEHDW